MWFFPCLVCQVIISILPTNLCIRSLEIFQSQKVTIIWHITLLRSFLRHPSPKYANNEWNSKIIGCYVIIIHFILNGISYQVWCSLHCLSILWSEYTSSHNTGWFHIQTLQCCPLVQIHHLHAHCRFETASLSLQSQCKNPKKSNHSQHLPEKSGLVNSLKFVKTWPIHQPLTRHFLEKTWLWCWSYFGHRLVKS